jgi:hypothetical protein
MRENPVNDVLLTVQRKQFTDPDTAEDLLLEFIQHDLHIEAVKVELRPLAVSLNSFNGFLTLADGRRQFFKTHVEPDSVINEFYNSEVLAKAGYPIMRPIQSSIEAGRQFLVYEMVDDPSVFDIARQIEGGSTACYDELVDAQQAADRSLFDIYHSTLAWQSPEDAAAAPVHQLFYHRLNGPRLRDGYDPGLTVALPRDERRMGELRTLPWTVNGQHYDESLDDLIARSIRLLRPARAGPSVIGHGDAHNGNVFFRRDGGQITYFDPAFGGRHDPLLDLAKPLFHNTFAMWMYFPESVAKNTSVRVRIDGGRIEVEHDYQLHPIRREFLASKLRNTVCPVIQELDVRGMLPADWRERIKAALFCCPLLTKVLTDRTAFPPEITLLGLSYAMEMGSESIGERSLIDQSLDQVRGVDAVMKAQAGPTVTRTPRGAAGPPPPPVHTGQ